MDYPPNDFWMIVGYVSGEEYCLAFSTLTSWLPLLFFNKKLRFGKQQILKRFI